MHASFPETGFLNYVGVNFVPLASKRLWKAVDYNRIG